MGLRHVISFVAGNYAPPHWKVFITNIKPGETRRNRLAAGTCLIIARSRFIKTAVIEMNMYVINHTNLPAIVWLKPGWG